MPSKKPKELWDAEPHTLAKLAILKNYLNAYFPIVGRSAKSSQEILYVDGFAGPNEYKNNSFGSPTIAVNAASEAIERAGTQWRAKGVNCVFIDIDEDEWIVENCRRKLEELTPNSRVRYRVVAGDFNKLLPSLIEEYPGHFHGESPLFVFHDPFGPTAVRFDKLSEILASDHSELLLNFDSDGLVRILEAGNADKNMTAIFGDESWRGELQLGVAPLLLARRALKLFKTRLRSLDGVNYAFAFEMQKYQGIPNYHLVFASKHRLGLEKMKEAMKRIAGKEGGFEFCDANVGTDSLFGFDQPEEWATVVHNEFAGQTVPAEQVWDYVLNETLLVNAKAVLAKLEKENFATIKRKPNAREARDLKSMESITFKSGPYVSPVDDPFKKGLFDGT